MRVRHTTAEIHASDELYVHIDVDPMSAFELVVGDPPGLEIKATDIEDVIKILSAAVVQRGKMLTYNETKP